MNQLAPQPIEFAKGFVGEMLSSSVKSILVLIKALPHKAESKENIISRVKPMPDAGH